MRISAIIPAAGSGSRFDNNKNKLLEDLQGKPVIIHTLEKIAAIDNIEEIIICTSTDLIDEIKDLMKRYNIPKIRNIILGGATRQESVFLGLKAYESENQPDFILIHDAARPLISNKALSDAVNLAFNKGSAVVAVPSKDTIKKVNSKTRQIIETLNRQELWNIQTPQIFKFKDILAAHYKFAGADFTDDSAMLEKLGSSIFISQGEYSNIKITTKEDIKIAEVFMSTK